MAVLLFVGTVAVAILKVDSKIFDGFALQLFFNAAINGVREPERSSIAAEFFRIIFDGL